MLELELAGFDYSELMELLEVTYTEVCFQRMASTSPSSAARGDLSPRRRLRVTRRPGHVSETGRKYLRRGRVGLFPA
jgi:hypothetical protein